MERKPMLGTLAGVAAVLILAGGAIAASQARGAAAATGPGPGAGHGAGAAFMMPGLMPPALLDKVGDELGLSPEQRQAIRGFRDDARPNFESLRQQLRAGVELLMRTQPDDPAYPTVVATVSHSTADLASQFVLQSSQLRSQIHAVLTKDQRTKLIALQAEFEARASERRGPGSPGEPPAQTAPPETR